MTPQVFGFDKLLLLLVNFASVCVPIPLLVTFLPRPLENCVGSRYASPPGVQSQERMGILSI